MSKRFTSSEKWDDPWYRRLEPRLKLFWDWLFTKCDIAGSIDPDYETASFQIGAVVSEVDIKEFGKRIQTLPSGRLLLVKFITFQYGFLRTSCRAHIPVMKLCDSLLIDYTYPIDRHGDRHGDRHKEQEQDSSLSSLLEDHREIEDHASNAGTHIIHTVPPSFEPFRDLWLRWCRDQGYDAYRGEMAAKKLMGMAPDEAGRRAILENSIIGGYKNLYGPKREREDVENQDRSPGWLNRTLIRLGKEPLPEGE